MYDDTTHYVTGILRATVKLADSKKFEEVNAAMVELFSNAEHLAVERFSELTKKQKDEVASRLHDDRVRAQGGT